jgi:hypothetical protein
MNQDTLPHSLAFKVKVYKLDVGFLLVAENHVQLGREPKVFTGAFANLTAVNTTASAELGAFFFDVMRHLNELAAAKPL